MNLIGKAISHYKILEKLGEGGMGVVYKAQDTKLDRIVALKFLPKHLLCDEEAKTRFVHEAKAASALDHQNIATIHEIDEVEGECFIAMAYIDGKSIKELIKEKEIEGWVMGKVIDVALQMAEGLSKAHQKGIVHRDIKSDNIMLTNQGLIKIMDFGLAKLKGVTGLTKTATTLGTMQYMSPEQAQGMEVDQRSDIFSFGVVLYEMITGRLPFEGEHEAAVIYSIVNETPEPLARYKASVPEGLQRIVEKAMEKDRRVRYQHVDYVGADLRRLKTELESGVTKTMETAGKATPSIAVLPFANLSADKEQEYFCDGIAEEILNALTHVEDLRVVARTSAFAFKGKHEDIREIGKKLNVETLLEGSVRKASNRLRISAQLINVADGYHIWSEKYDREMDDVFAIQDEISLAIVDKLKLKLLVGEKARLIKRYTEDLEAHNLYLKGRFFWNKRTEAGLKKALEYFGQAIKKDPDYALAYAGLADAYNVLPTYMILSREEACPKAKEFALKALELDDTLAEAHTSTAEIKTNFDNDFEAAEREFKQAIILNPGYATAHHWYSMLLDEMGRFEEAVKEGEHALELDPLSSVINAYLASVKIRLWDWGGAEELYRRVLEVDPTNGTGHAYYAMLLIQMGRKKEGVSEIQHALKLAPHAAIVNLGYGWVLHFTRQYDKAIEQLKKTIKMAPFSVDSHILLGLAYLDKEMYEEAPAEFRKAKELSSDPDLIRAEAHLGWAYAKMGKRDKAREVLDDLMERSKQTHVSPSFLAWLCFALGENDQGFEWFEKAYEERDRWLVYLKIEPGFDSLRSDPRYTALLKKMGLEK